MMESLIEFLYVAGRYLKENAILAAMSLILNTKNVSEMPVQIEHENIYDIAFGVMRSTEEYLLVLQFMVLRGTQDNDFMEILADSPSSETLEENAFSFFIYLSVAAFCILIGSIFSVVKFIKNKKKQLPPEDKKDQLPPNNKKDQLPPNNKKDQLPPDNKKDQLSVEDKKDQLSVEDKKDQLLPNNKKDQLTVKDKKDQLTVKDKKDQLLPNNKKDQLTVKDKKDQLTVKDKKDQLLPVVTQKQQEQQQKFELLRISVEHKIKQVHELRFKQAVRHLQELRNALQDKNITKQEKVILREIYERALHTVGQAWYNLNTCYYKPESTLQVVLNNWTTKNMPPFHEPTYEELLNLDQDLDLNKDALANFAFIHIPLDDETENYIIHIFEDISVKIKRPIPILEDFDYKKQVYIYLPEEDVVVEREYIMKHATFISPNDSTTNVKKETVASKDLFPVKRERAAVTVKKETVASKDLFPVKRERAAVTVKKETVASKDLVPVKEQPSNVSLGFFNMVSQIVGYFISYLLILDLLLFFNIGLFIIIVILMLQRKKKK